MSQESQSTAVVLPPSRWQLILAFGAIYTIWGSTYLAIRFAIETLPPFLMAGTRFLVAGAILYAWVRLRGTPRPARFHWPAAIAVGGMLLMGGNGLVTWAEQTVPSSIAALLVATVPLWMVLLDWLRRDGVRPGRAVVAGLILGFLGVVLLIGPRELTGRGELNLGGAAMVVLASMIWAAGSLYSRQARLPASPMLATAMEMLAGGALLIVAGSVTGEWGRLALDTLSLRSFLALLYLIVFGSLIAFTAYVWLLKVSTPAHVGTYAYVNPVVAVFLGWSLGGEPVSARTLAAAAVIIAAVVIITTHHARNRQQPVKTPPKSEARETAVSDFASSS